MIYGWYETVDEIPSRHPIEQLEAPDQEGIVIDALTLEKFHQICYWDLSQRRNFDCSTSATVNLNTIIVRPSRDQLEDSVEIAFLPNEEVYVGDWETAAGATREIHCVQRPHLQPSAKAVRHVSCADTDRHCLLTSDRPSPDTVSPRRQESTHVSQAMLTGSLNAVTMEGGWTRYHNFILAAW